jgi:hypothetical protein
VPIGLINSAWGGTPVEAWMPKEALEGEPDFQPIYDRWQKQIEDSRVRGSDPRKRRTSVPKYRRNMVRSYNRTVAAGRLSH